MLDSLRSFAGSPIGIVVFAALIIGLLFFGLSGFSGTSSIAQVGSQEITQPEFAQEYDATLRRLSIEQGLSFTPSEAEQAQVPDFVLFQLIQRAAFQDNALQLGLSLSDEMVAKAIAALPNFKTSDGVFSPGLVQNYLRATGLTEQELADLQLEQLLRTQVAQAVTAAELALPEIYQRILAEYYGEERVISYTVLTPGLLDDGEAVEPTEEELVAYFQENTADWQAPETRRVGLLELTPEKLADIDAVTDEQAMADYLARQDQFGTPESRNVWQFIFSSQAEADLVGARLAEGQTYDDLVAAESIDPTNLGVVTRDELFDAAVAEAAFSLKAGDAVIVEGRAGATLVHVSEVVAGDIEPFEDVADQIRRDIAERLATVAIADLFLQIEDARAGGLILSDVGAMFDLPVETVEFDLRGNGVNGDPFDDLPGGNALFTNAFESDVGLNDAPIRLEGQNAFLWFEVVEILPPREWPLEEIRDRVVERWHEEAAGLRLQGLAESIVGLLENDEPTAQIAAELGVTFQLSEPLLRSSSPPEQASSATVQAAFGGPLGFVTVIPDAAGDGLVVQQVVSITTPDTGPESEPIAGVAATSLNIADEVFERYLLDVRVRIGPISANWSLIRQIIGIGQAQLPPHLRQ